MEAAAASRHLEIVLLNELNAGTFARLYLAEARASGGIDRIVAVKILREQWSDTAEIVTRTRDEAKLLARLRHKNILRVEDLAQIDGQLGIIMEYVDGLDLKQLVEELARRGQRVPSRVAFQILQESASALHAAYAKVPVGLDRPLRVVHRDIKPGNIMVSVEGEVKVLDFGTARSQHAARAAQTGAMRFGSLKYMSPERREGDRGEHSSDVYALGQTLVELLTGEWLPMLPQEMADHDEEVSRILDGLPALGMSNREWDKAARQVLKQMLAGDPALRPSAEQIHKLMRAFSEQAPGPSLEAWAHDVVLPITREVRGAMSGGSLAGQRFVLSMGGSDPGSSASRRKLRTVEPSLGAATPIAPPKANGQATPLPGRRDNARAAAPLPADGTMEVVRNAGPMTNPRPFPEPAAPRPKESLRSDSVPAPVPASRAPKQPDPRLPPSPSPAAESRPVVAPPQPQRTPSRPPATPVQAEDKPTVMEPVIRSAPLPPPIEPEVQERSWLPWLAAAVFIGGGLAVILLTLLFVAAWLLSGQRADAPAAAPTTPAATAPAEPTKAEAKTESKTEAKTEAKSEPAGTSAAAAPASAATELSVVVTGMSPQWMKLLSGDTVTLKGTDSLAGPVPAGDYQLALKAVGKPELRGAVKVADAKLSLTCAAEGDGVVCKGGAAPIKLAAK